MEILSDDEEEEEVITMTEDAYKPLSLEKMIALISLLVEKSRGDDNQLQISEKDYNSLIGGKVSDHNDRRCLQTTVSRENDSSDLTARREVKGRRQSTTDLRERL